MKNLYKKHKKSVLIGMTVILVLSSIGIYFLIQNGRNLNAQKISSRMQDGSDFINEITEISIEKDSNKPNEAIASYTSKTQLSDSIVTKKANASVLIEVYENKDSVNLREWEITELYKHCSQSLDTVYYGRTTEYICGHQSTTEISGNAILIISGYSDTAIENYVALFRKTTQNVGYSQKNTLSEEAYQNIKTSNSSYFEAATDTKKKSIETELNKEAERLNSDLDRQINLTYPSKAEIDKIQRQIDVKKEIAFFAPYLEEWSTKISKLTEKLNTFYSNTVNTINTRIQSLYSTLNADELKVLINDVSLLNDSYYNQYKEGWNTSFADIENKIQDAKIVNYKNASKNISYKDLMRNPTSYYGEQVHFFGKVLQIIDGYGSKEMRIGVTCEPYNYLAGYYCEDTIYIVYSGDTSIIVDDYINLWGEASGTKTYTTVLGSSVTLPKVKVEYIELSE